MPMIGTESEVAGTFSATISIKTENATKQVKPSVTFSPDDVGNLRQDISFHSIRLVNLIRHFAYPTRMTCMLNMITLHME